MSGRWRREAPGPRVRLLSRAPSGRPIAPCDVRWQLSCTRTAVWRAIARPGRAESSGAACACPAPPHHSSLAARTETPWSASSCASSVCLVSRPCEFTSMPLSIPPVHSTLHAPRRKWHASSHASLFVHGTSGRAHAGKAERHRRCFAWSGSSGKRRSRDSTVHKARCRDRHVRVHWRWCHAGRDVDTHRLRAQHSRSHFSRTQSPALAPAPAPTCARHARNTCRNPGGSCRSACQYDRI